MRRQYITIDCCGSPGAALGQVPLPGQQARGLPVPNVYRTKSTKSLLASQRRQRQISHFLKLGSIRQRSIRCKDVLAESSRQIKEPVHAPAPPARQGYGRIKPVREDISYARIVLLRKEYSPTFSLLRFRGQEEANVASDAKALVIEPVWISSESSSRLRVY